jgi:hypothetical protein
MRQNEFQSDAANSAEPVEHNDKPTLNWLQLNVLNPAINSALVESHNAVANAFNEHTGGHLQKWTARETTQATLGSKEWVAQTISSGIAGIAPYIVAGLVVRKPLALLSEGAEALNLSFKSQAAASSTLLKDAPFTGTILDRSLTTAAKILRSQHANPIIGAALYDSVRDTHESESHNGNVAGGVTAFGVYQVGNYISRALPLGGRLVALAATGMVGAMSQATVSKEVSTGTLPSGSDLAHAALSGAFMNIALPTGQFMASHLVESVNMKIGQGEPLNRFVAQRENATAPEIAKLGQIFSLDSVNKKVSEGQLFLQAKEQSPAFKTMLADNASVRIQHNSGNTAYHSITDKVTLSTNNSKPEDIAHELTHRGQHLSGEIETVFKNAQQLLAEGKTQQAADAYVEARINLELKAMVKEQEVASQRGAKPKADTIRSEEKTLDDLRLLARQESTRFIESNGEFRPTEFFQERSKSSAASAAQWRESLANWAQSSFKEKRDLLAALHQAPEQLRAEIFKKGMFETEAQQTRSSDKAASERLWLIRGAADRQFTSIPAAERKEVFRSLISSDDYTLRLLALTHIKDLPAAERLQTFKEVLKDTRALAVPTPTRWLYGDDEQYRPWVSMNSKHVVLRETLRKLPSELLVESIASMKATDRKTAWDHAYNHTGHKERTLAGDKETKLIDSDTRLAAVKNLAVLPLNERFSVWSRETASILKFRDSGKSLDTLVSQIPNLPETQRGEAMHQLFASTASFSGESARMAFASLHPAERMPTWEKFFARSTSDWQSKSKQYDEDYFLDNLKAQHSSDSQPPTTALSFNFQKNTIGVNRGLAAAIPTLDATDRLNAWQRVIALNPGRTYINDLAKALPSLPEQSQKFALEKLLQRAGEINEGIPESQIHPVMRRLGIPVAPIGLDGGKFADALEQMPLKQWPMVVETIMSMPPSEMRTSLVKSIPMSTRVSKDTETSGNDDTLNSLNHYSEIFSTATKLGKPEDFRTIGRWWHEVRFLEEEDLTTNQYQSRVREKLAQNIEPEPLARMIFHRHDSADVDAFAYAHPEVVRALAKHSTYYFENEGQSNFDHLENVLHAWNRDYSLADTTKELLKPVASEKDKYGDAVEPAHDLMRALYSELFKLSSTEQRSQSLELIKNDLFNADPANSQIAEESRANLSFNFPLSLAAQAGLIDKALIRQTFTPAIDSKLHDPSTSYAWKLAAAREVATMQRENVISHEDISLPDLRLPKLNRLSQTERQSVRQQFVSALFDDEEMKSFIGDGPLGRLMPEHFGHFQSNGGIVGRPQHSGHDFDLDVHTLKVMQNIREHPEFDSLPVKQQEDVLAAAFLHDIAKLPNAVDENHDWIAPKLAWGVLSTMELPPVRIQRIVNLMARHTDASFSPEELHSTRLDDAVALDDLATFYRHPYALRQLRIMNEADIKAVHEDSHLWKPEVQQELDRIQAMAAPRVAKLNENLVPILTSELPSRFSFVTMNKPYALLAHVSGHIQDSFLKQLNLIQSSAFSVSTSLITDNHRQFYYNGEPVFALFGGPWEQISQAYRDNLGTGTSVDWQGHVDLSRDWLTSDRAVSFAKEIDAAAKRSKFQREGSGPLNHLAGARKYFAQFDSFDELVATRGVDSPEVRMQRDIHRAITSDSAGLPLMKHNEVKLNNPTLIGFGLARGGKPVHFEAMPYATLSRLFSNNDAPPSWASGENASTAALPSNTIKIAPTLWQELLNRDLPIVSLDD